MQNFHDIMAYQKSYDLSRLVWSDIKDCRNFRLRDQLFGAISSIPAHLAEFAAYDSNKEKLVRIRRSIGEANEAEHWLCFCRDSGEIPEDKARMYIEKIIEVRKMLYGFLHKIGGEKSENEFRNVQNGQAKQAAAAQNS